MPDKKQQSISYKAMNYSIVSCILLGLIALVVGLYFYSTEFSEQYIKHAFDIARYTATTSQNNTNAVELADAVMKVYRGLSEEQRQLVGTPEYNAFFADIVRFQGSSSANLMDMMDTYTQGDEVDDLYMAMYDEETSALVYMVDPQEENQFKLGEWEHVEMREAKKFLSWNGKGELYDIGRTEDYGWLCSVGYPLKDGDRICAFILADMKVDNIINRIIGFALRIVLILPLLTALIAWLLSSRINKAIVQPINKIADAAAGYAADKREGKAVTNRFSGLDIKTGDELENLSVIMADMENSLSQYERKITAITAEKERISTELIMGAVIQESMLPHDFPPFPDRQEFDIYATMKPAKEVGGDFYDFFLIDDDHLALVIADVSGKGIPAALFMMVSKVIIQSCAMLGRGPAEILQKTNEGICSNNQAEMFVTVWIGILQISTGRITAANAGHEYPVLTNADGSFELVKDRHGFVVGGMENIKYREYEMQLHPGDRLFVYTDGVPEAENENQELYGTERMLAVLNRKTEAETPRDILEKVHDDIISFAGSAEQFDDITMMCLEYRGTSA